jgi:GAF domain-containing protein
MAQADLWMSTTLVELAEVADTEPGEAGYASLLTTRVAERMAPAAAGLMIAGHAGDLTVRGASSPAAGELAALQIRLREGPCIDCHATGQPVLAQDVAAASDIWPRFAPAAGAAGFGMASALPVRRREQAIGVLFVAASGGRLLTAVQLGELEVLARSAAIAIAQQRELRRSTLVAEQLQRALDSRILIEQANGAIAARLGISPDGAFELLRAYARHANLTLADVAAQAICNKLSPHDLMASYDRHRHQARHSQQAAHS